MKSGFAAFFSILLLLQTGCVSKFYFAPSAVIQGQPDDLGLEYETVSIMTKDSVRLTGWFIKSPQHPVATVLHFHGRSGNISDCLLSAGWLAREGFNVFLFDYRGYGLSGEEPSVEGVCLDCIEAMNYVCARTDVDNLVLWGQSLGGTLALATFDAVRTPKVKAVAIESTFYSFRAIVRDSMLKALDLAAPINSYILVENEHSACDSIRTIPKVPLLIVHGRNDSVVSFNHARNLFEEAREPKESLWTDGGHLEAFGSNRLNRARLVEFFRSSLQPSGALLP